MADFGFKNDLQGHFCRYRYLLQNCDRHFEPDSRAPIGGNFSSVSTYLDVHSDQSSALYYFVWDKAPLFVVKRLNYCLSSILKFTNNYQEPPLERSLSLRMLVYSLTTLKRNFQGRKLYDPGFERDLLMTLFYMDRK